MPRAIAVPVRERVVHQHQAGQPLRSIAAQCGIGYRSVLRVWRRFDQEGPGGLATHYERCGPGERLYSSVVQEAALSLKREHRGWGGPLVRIELAHFLAAEGLAGQKLPAVRTLQSWFRQAGLAPPRATRPPVPRARAREVHEVWELDAKERMRLADGSGVSTLNVVDEASGALLEAAPFPPVLLDAGACGGRPGDA